MSFPSNLTSPSEMLRYFEKFKLLNPIRVGKYRYYTNDNFAELGSTKMYQSLGFELREIMMLKEHMQAKDTTAAKTIVANLIEKDQIELEKIKNRQFFLQRLKDKFASGNYPHSKCFLCASKGYKDRDYWGEKVDLLCDPCIKKFAADLTQAQNQTDEICVTCGKKEHAPSFKGVDGSICTLCVESFTQTSDK